MPFILVAYSMWATPGPNNMMLTYYGARFGIRLSVPHISNQCYVCAGKSGIDSAGNTSAGPRVD
jgi:hypothetical protein